MTLESQPQHIRTPHLRPIQPIPVQKDGKQFVALRDPAMLVKQTMVVQPQVLPLLQHFRGEEDLQSLSEKVNVEVEQLVKLAQGLDQVGLLWGPTFEKLEQTLKDQIAQRGAFPANAAASLATDGSAGREQIDQWLAEADDPELEGTIRAIVAPHLDYQRGWPNYAAAYRCLDYAEKPDRVVVLGTNHFGLGDGVVLTQYGFESPFGRNESDTEVVSRLVESLGERLTVDQLDHMREHSIQLHLPWIQHRWGDVPLVAALVPDPLQPMIDEDEGRVDHEAFVNALREILEDVGGNTIFVASADLSHVGPQFGEPRPVDDQRRHDVEMHDREMMGKFLTGDPEEFLSAMRWNNNPTRWCSIGNMAATLMLAQPESVELIDYRQASDDKGHILVSSAAMALL